MEVDVGLIRRLEATAAAGSVALVEAIKALDPSTVADSRRFLDGALVAMGPGRHVNRAIGVTLDHLSPSDVETIEAFFVDRCVAPMIELSAWAPTSTVEALSKRGYVSEWIRSTFARRPGVAAASSSTDLRIDRVEQRHHERWLRVFNDGFGAVDRDAVVANDEIGRASLVAPDSHIFLACIDGKPVGCGSVHIVDGVAWLGGAATLPTFRRRGVQAALIAHRLAFAAATGCELAAVSRSPTGLRRATSFGSGSSRCTPTR